MSKKFVWTCDYCDKSAEGDAGIPSGFYQMQIEVRSSTRHRDLEAVMCVDCWDRTIDPSPRGIVKRIMSLFSFRL